MRTFPYRHFAITAIALVVLTTARLGRAASLLEPHLDADDNYSETMTAIADLEDGTYTQVQLNVSNLGVGDANGACRMLVVEPKQKAWTASKRVDRDEWSFANDTLTIASCSITSSGAQTTINARLDGGAIKLVLASAIQPREPPDAKLTIEGKSFATAIAIPWAKVDATLEVPGRKARTVSGFGYMDHSRSTTLPAQLATRWVRFRALSGSDSILLLARNLPDGSLRGWMWKQKEPFPRPLSKLKLTRVDEKDQAKGYTIEGTAGNATFEISVESQLYRYAPVEEYGVLGVLARSVVGNPVTRTYRATLAFRDGATSPNAAGSPGDTTPVVGPTPQRGILEVQHVQ